jgi:UDP-3-O-[3-hydroxymyristoyl] glucosamine N-acyltransferase
MRITELVERFGGRLDGDESVEVCDLKGVEFAGSADATFATDDRMLAAAEATPACCVIVPAGARASDKPLIRCESPEAYAADLLEFFHPVTVTQPGIHATAIIDETAEVADTATIGPHVTVGRNCRIGTGVHLMASVAVGDDCEIGQATVIHPNATVYPGTRIGSGVLIHAGAVIGCDGFGFFPEGDRLRKWPHVGNVVIEDDVEIGANACIDRAKFGTTLVRRGAKIDNLVQVAHNCDIGHSAVLAGQTGLAGSVVLEDGVVCAGQVGIADHITIGAGAQLAAQSGLIGDVPAGSVLFGTPAKPRRRALEEVSLLSFLADHRAVVKKLVRQATKE